MNPKYLFAFTLLMISTLQCSAMYKGYYEKKHRVYNPYLTGMLAVFSAFSAKKLLESACDVGSYDRTRALKKMGAGTGCGLVAIAAARKCYKDIYAMKHYHIKNEE
jgi:hypothetical protein